MNKLSNEYHDFNCELEYEHSNFIIQDKFYRDHGVTKINRFDFDTSEGKEKQKQDIDLEFLSPNGKTYTISEKRRRGNFGDLLFEIYSVYEKNIYGWSITGKSDVTMYFVTDEKHPERSYIGEFKTQELHNLIEDNNIQNQISNESWKDLYESSQNKSDISLKFNCSKDTVKCTLIKSKNKGYVTMSVGIPFSILDKSGLKYNLFDWNGNKLTGNILWKK